VNAFLPEPGDAGLEASRSTNDRLMIFINERPVVQSDISKVSVHINSGYWKQLSLCVTCLNSFCNVCGIEALEEKTVMVVFDVKEH
jgi:hypothetical protein